MRASSTVRDFTSGPIARQLIQFSIPLILGDLFQLSYNMVDTIVIGRFAGSVGLAAVGTCDQIMTLLILGVSGICIGASVLMGRFFGARQEDRLLEELRTTVALGMIFSAVILALGLPFTEVLFRLMSVQPEALPDASVYMRVIFAGLPFTCLYNIYAAAFSAARKIEDIGLLPGRSVSSGITAFTAQNEGAAQPDRTEEGFRRAILLEFCIGLLVSAAVLLLRRPLMSLFADDAAMLSEGVRYFSIIGFCYFLPCLTNGFQGYLRGSGHMTASLLGSLTQITVRVLVTLLAAPAMGIPAVGLACVAGWSAMLLWQIPWRRRQALRHSSHPDTE